MSITHISDINDNSDFCVSHGVFEKKFMTSNTVSDNGLREWRLSKGWTQADLGQEIKRGQSTVAGYESGEIPVPPDIEERLRELGYTGPLLTVTKPPKTLVDMDASTFYDEAERVVQGIERKGGAPIEAERRRDLVRLALTEVQRSHALGRPETAQDLIERWWAMTGGNPG